MISARSCSNFRVRNDYTIACSSVLPLGTRRNPYGRPSLVGIIVWTDQIEGERVRVSAVRGHRAWTKRKASWGILRTNGHFADFDRGRG